MFTVLVVEDDASLNKMICAKLNKEQFKAIPAFDGEEALEVMDREHIDLIIRDIMMPKMDGYELTKLLRDTGYFLSILMITAKDQLEDMEKGFVAGTDDYMIKPINLKEMVLRVKALLRRAHLQNKKHIKIGNTELDYAGLTVTVNGKTHDMPPKEFYLLFKLLNNPNKIFTRLELLDEICGMESDTDERNVDAHIKKLRKKFEGVSDFEIVTVRGLGYKAVFFYHGELTTPVVILLCLLVCLLAMIIGGVALYYGTAYFVKPIEEVNNAVNRVAKGDFDVRVSRSPHSGKNAEYVHELDELEANVNCMGAELAVLDIQQLYLSKQNDDEKLNITYFAIEPGSFLEPSVSEGVQLSASDAENPILLDDDLALEGIEVGDIVTDSSTGLEFTVAGFADDQMYGHTSIGFITTDTYTQLRTLLNPMYKQKYHAVVLRGGNAENVDIDGTELVAKADIIENIPSYKAEHVTITMIKWVLTAVSAAIIGRLSEWEWVGLRVLRQVRSALSRYSARRPQIS